MWARRYDEAFAVCKKMANEDPTFAEAHSCLASAYWAKRNVPGGHKEWKLHGQLSKGDEKQSEFASALEQGFRSGGWNGALDKGIQVRLGAAEERLLLCVQNCSALCRLGKTKIRLSNGSTCLSGARFNLIGLNTDFLLDPCVPILALLS